MIPSFRYRLFIPSYDVSITSRQRPISLWQPCLPYVNPFACPPPAGKYSSPLSTPFMPRVSTGHAPFPMSPQGTSAANSSGKLLVCRVLSDFQVFMSFPLIPLVWPVFFERLCFMWIIRLPINDLSTEFSKNLFI